MVQEISSKALGRKGMAEKNSKHGSEVLDNGQVMAFAKQTEGGN